VKFKKGKSGNPNGRPTGKANKKTVELKTLLERIDWETVFDRLDNLSKQETATGLAALKLFLEYRFGKPREKENPDMTPDEFGNNSRILAGRMREAL
jgi:hypothetical protein